MEILQNSGTNFDWNEDIFLARGKSNSTEKWVVICFTINFYRGPDFKILLFIFMVLRQVEYKEKNIL